MKLSNLPLFTTLLTISIPFLSHAQSPQSQLMQNGHTIIPISETYTPKSTTIIPNTPNRQATQKDLQVQIEESVLKKLRGISKTDANLQGMSLIYWSKNNLYVLLKDPTLIPKVTKSIHSVQEPLLASYVGIGLTKYSQHDYDMLAEKFTAFYATKAPQGHILKVVPDPSRDLLLIHVDQEYPYMLDSIKSAFGHRIQVIVPKVTALSDPPKVEPTPLHF